MEYHVANMSSDGLRLTLSSRPAATSARSSSNYSVISRSCESHNVKMTLKLTDNARMTGYRLFDMEKLDDHINHLGTHAASCRSLQRRVMDGEDPFRIVKDAKRYGFAMILLVECLGCHMKFYVDNSKKVQTGQHEHFDINVRAVWGSMVTVQGASSLSELSGTMDMPSLSRQHFIKIENAIGTQWEAHLQSELLAAGAEERRLAMEEGTFFKGIPAITVICDGGWSKRSHKHSYNALGGVGVIIGAKTGKILYLGVRNKNCYICTHAKNKNVEPKEHQCFKNWTSSSQAMEADIIVDGFMKAESMHGVRFMYIIADGDSSVYSRITEEVPEWGCYVTKVECANHVCKCLRTHLERLVEDNREFKGRNNLTKNIRSKIVCVARSAIAYNSNRMKKENLNKAEAVKCLKDDIANTLNHLSGDHTECSSFCRVVRDQALRQESEVADVHESDDIEDDDVSTYMKAPVGKGNKEGDRQQQPPDLETQSDAASVDPEEFEAVMDDQVDFWKSSISTSEVTVPVSHERSSFQPSSDIRRHVSILLQRVIGKSDRLICNATTNLAESWMNVRMKFDGGKIFNRCGRGSWNYRCYGGGLRTNMGADWGPDAWQSAIGTEPGEYFKTCYGKRKRHHEISLKNQQKPEAKKKRLHRRGVLAKEGDSVEARQAYGPEAVDVSEDITPEELTVLKEKCLNDHIYITDEKLQHINEETKTQSCSEMWFAERKKRLTASNFYEIARRNPSRKINKFIKRLLYSTFTGTSSTRKGLRLERFAKEEYVRFKQQDGCDVTVVETGLCISRQHPYLAASPDGVVEGDPTGPGLIEIKHVLMNKTLSFKQAVHQQKDFCLELKNNKLQLKKTHKFMYQLQGQLFVCEKDWVDLVVRRVDPYEMYVERIYQDQELWSSEMLPKLEAFYMKVVLPELANPRYGKSPGIREPGLWYSTAAATEVHARHKIRKQKHHSLTAISPALTQPATRESQRRKKQKFLGRRISHEWEDEETGQKTWYTGHVMKVVRGRDGDQSAVYDVFYEHDDEIYEIDHLAEDFEKNSVTFLDI